MPFPDAPEATVEADLQGVVFILLRDETTSAEQTVTAVNSVGIIVVHEDFRKSIIDQVAAELMRL